MLPITLTTPRLTLREVENTDQEMIFKGFSNPEITKFMEVTYATFEATAEQMDWYKTNRLNGTGCAWTVINNQQQFIGVVSAYYINQKHKRCEIGYWFFPEYWGQGYAKESIVAMLNCLSTQFNMHRIAAEVEPENTASIALLKRLDFKQEALLKDFEFRNNQFADLTIWAKIFDTK